MASNPTNYQRIINELDPTANARHVEAMMRSEFNTLDHLPREMFVEFIGIVRAIPDYQLLNALAESYGL